MGGLDRHSAGSRNSDDVDSMFLDLYERNQKWQRARDARIEQHAEEVIARQVQAPPRPRTPRARSCEPGVSCSSGVSSQVSRRSQADSATTVAAPVTCLQIAASESCPAVMPMPQRPTLTPVQMMQQLSQQPGQPVRVPHPRPGKPDSEGTEAGEVMDH